MHEVQLLVTLTGGLTAALLLGYITHRLGLSPIVGYLLGGTLLKVTALVAFTVLVGNRAIPYVLDRVAAGAHRA